MSTSGSAIRLAPLATTGQHHAHAHRQIVIGLSGAAEFDIDGARGHVTERTGCIVPAGREHYYRGVGDNSQLIIDLPDAAPGLNGAHHHHRHLFDQPRYFTLDTTLCLYLQFMVAEMNEAATDDHNLLTTTLLASLSRRLAPEAAAPRSRLNIRDLDEWIEQHLAETLKVKDLARRACLSTAHFTELFRDHTGLPPYRYILHKRLGAARALLEETTLPLVTIAERTGFANQSALSHAFRRHFGQSPGSLRIPRQH
ncbi:AraC family transcriptional regulator [Kushneria sinocarnis]|uniref:AraC family transcriptional regulator n=1 Tax=Kushneria sinocarnis TaxID=595502 RepID=A0A420WUF9_9GAMM|nr:helix-turn-helix domain-containing protein [Kushneria sinocarnis]RKQ97089.1 AraC family transcriptional regulator [Kushneria sinocarnis]